MTALFVDHSNLDALSQTLAENAADKSAQQHEQHFWATPVRLGDSPVQETLEISLSSARLINVLSFDLARFPHTTRVQYYDGTRWADLIDRDLGAPVSVSILQSVPQTLAKATSVPGHLHPQHSYSGHWEQVELRIRPTTVQRLRLILQRSVLGSAPRDVAGVATPYSLAVMNLRVGYQIASKADVPRAATRTDSLNVRNSFATTDDLLGSSVDYSLRTNSANSVLVEGSNSPIWRSEPQPYPQAVVNFYADIRNGLGQPQIIDRIFIDPINNGPHLSVYYSNDTPSGAFTSVSEPLTAIQAVLGGLAAINRGVLSLGSYGQDADVTIDNEAIGFDPSLPWWVGIRAQPSYGIGVDSNEHPLFDCQAFRISLTSVGILLVTVWGDRLEMPFNYLGRQQLTLIASYDGHVLRLRARGVSDDQEALLTPPQAMPAYEISQITVGSSSGGSLLGNADIYDLVIKEEVLPGDDFLDFPDVYSTVTQFAGDDSVAATNSLLRLDVSSPLVDAEHPSGFFGGIAQKYESMNWTPIPRDYLMQRGWMSLPSTKARFLKLEITNLVAEYRDVHLPISQLVKTFPPEVIADYRASQSGRNRALVSREIGIATQQSLSSGLPYSDFPIYISTGGTQKGYTNTQAYVADDYSSSIRLFQTQGPAWAYQNWHSPVTAPRFNRVGPHRYSIEPVSQSTKVAYFAGLRRIRFARTIHTGQDDSAQFEDLLQDELNLASSNWVYENSLEALHSGAAQRAIATSVVYGSTRPMRGVQFAAQQSPPRQMLPDPDFADPQTRYWNFVGDAQNSNQAIVAPLIGTVLQVSRAVSFGLWEDIRPVYALWSDLTSNAVTYGQLSNPSRQVQTVGGVSSTQQAQPAGGRLYGAARVFANTDLVSPLWVQIVDSVTDVVLAESSAVVKRDQVTEWYTSYTIGEGGTRHTNLWGDLVGPNQQVWASFVDSFARPNGSPLGRMDSGQLWNAVGTGSLVLASAKASCTVAGQGNSIDTLTPWGTLTVGLGTAITTGTASASVPLVDLGAYVLYNDGRIQSKTTVNVPFSITLATNDVLKFEFKPTRSLTGPQTPAGTIPEVSPYAVVVSRNGSYVNTIVSAREPTSLRGLYGAVGQIFTSFAWTPSYVEIPGGNPVMAMPMPLDGALSGSTAWIDSSGASWPIDGVWAFSNRAAYQGRVPIATAASAGCGLYRDFGQNYGSLVFSVAALAATVSTTSYYLATLDLQSDNSLLLRADGALVRTDGTVLKSNALPSPTAGPVTVRFMKPSQLSSSFRTTYSILSTDTQALIFHQNGNVISVVSGTNLWSGTVRGINGYSDGSNSSVIEGFGWFPEGAYLALDTRSVTWGDVDRNNTYRYSDLAGSADYNTNPVYMRVVQKATSSDTWYMDTVGLFHDPIVWEFSNDGGHSFQPAFDIRNNPQGVLLFRTPDLSNSANPPQNRLVWRVSAWGPDAWVSHLTIRPWYQGLTQGVPVRSSASQQGPNVNPYDHYSPIEQDPRFRVWSKPIPRDWWFAYRDLDPSRISDITTQWITLTLGDSLVLED